MKLQNEKYLNLLDQVQDVSILVVGDVMLDHYIWGKAERLSDEAPVPIVWVGRTEDRLGGAANDIRNLTGLGVQRVSLVGVIGDDSEATRIELLVNESQLYNSLLIRDSSRPTTVKTRVIARNQQVVRIDRESQVNLNETIENQLINFLDENLEKYDAIILSDYGKGLFSEKLSNKILEWRKSGKIGLDVRPFILDPHPKNNDLYKYASVIKPNRAEAEKATGQKITCVDDAFKVAKLLQDKWFAELVVLSLSEDGMVIYGGDLTQPLHIKTKANQVADVSGAGDTVTSVFTAVLATGGSIEQAGNLANLAASIVVAEVGTAAITREKIINALKN